jgi:hypothetical protein
LASLSSHSNNTIRFATLLEWYKIRDTFFGDNWVTQNIPLAIEMASTCQHPDARWLTEACAGKDVKTKEDAKRVFSGENEARALCFMWMLGDQENLALLLRSAELGFAYAQALVTGEPGVEEFKFAQLAAAQCECVGFFVLGLCLFDGVRCERNLDEAKLNFLRASELGSVAAMSWLGRLLEDSDPQRWRWWGRAAALGSWVDFFAGFAKQVELFNSSAGSAAAVVFAIGRALQGHVNEEARTIFSRDYDFDSLIGPAKQAIAFYEAQIQATKDAMRAWTLVGIKLKVVKDVRKLIAKLIWDSREEALYKT